MAEHNDLGNKGEQLAADYLKAKGFQILVRNWRFQKAEIDIICKDKKTMLIVEVKSRSSEEFESPTDKITLGKQRLLIKAADAYIQENEIDLECRFDVITLIFEGQKHKLNHIEDAFGPLVK